MRPIFCGNVEYDARQSDLERLFAKYGRVERVDIKSGFAFIYMDDERDAEDAIRGLDRCEFGRQGRRLRVEWTKHERGGRGPVNSRRSSSNNRCTKTLFVINFDPINTRSRDLERHFDIYGKILNIRIRRNFAFIQYENQEDATKALDATNMSKFMDRVLSVEYAIRDDDDRRNGYSPERRDYGRSPERSRDRRRSLSPYGQTDRASPDYGRGSNPYNKSNQRGSPDYGNGRRESPVHDSYPRDHSPRRGRESSRSPKPEHLHSPRLERSRSPRPDCSSKPELSHSPRPGRSPKPECSGSPRNEHSFSPRQELPPSPAHELSNSPRREPSGSPQPENSHSS